MDGQEANDAVDAGRSRFPHCIVWTPIPVLTWIFPFIGHMGIALTSGVIHDFSGCYCVTVDSMAFGAPYRYIQCDLSSVAGSGSRWDDSIERASDEYKRRTHSLLWDNCHSHVAMALNFMPYKRKANWNMMMLSMWMFCSGRYVSFWAFVKHWLPVSIVYLLILISGLVVVVMKT